MPNLRWLKHIAAGVMLCASVAWAEAARSDEKDVISIGGGVSEIIYALGQEHRLVARDTTSYLPKDILSLPNVGYLHHLSAEGILRFGPSLILADETAGPPETIEQLKAARITITTIPNGYDAHSIPQKIRIIAKALDTAERGEALIKDIEADFTHLAEIVAADETPPKRVLFILAAQNGSLRVAGKNTPVDAMIALAGGVNVAAVIDGYQTMSDEAVIAANPEIILRASYQDGSSPISSQLFELPVLAASSAAQNGAVVSIDALKMTGFGPSTAQTALSLHEAFSQY
ncbi:hemin ABC transporter substrate-binding protein [Phaeobacter sp. B1627]|uniref:heme/hemin ABC transporter substrate-binding protein n=1 Tax=Phaeobacter sp. B1627 TaxID=2583809 RepID=UPI00159EE6E4|nr:ABC transporter substrate-binding protein [Phaeobacter sp. B1627]